MNFLFGIAMILRVIRIFLARYIGMPDTLFDYDPENAEHLESVEVVIFANVIVLAILRYI